MTVLEYRKMLRKELRACFVSDSPECRSVNNALPLTFKNGWDSAIEHVLSVLRSLPVKCVPLALLLSACAAYTTPTYLPAIDPVPPFVVHPDNPTDSTPGQSGPDDGVAELFTIGQTSWKDMVRHFGREHDGRVGESYVWVRSGLPDVFATFTGTRETGRVLDSLAVR